MHDPMDSEGGIVCMKGIIRFSRKGLVALIAALCLLLPLCVPLLISSIRRTGARR